MTMNAVQPSISARLESPISLSFLYSRLNPAESAPRLHKLLATMLAVAVVGVSVPAATAEAREVARPYGTLLDTKTGQAGAFAQWTDDVAVTVTHVPTESEIFKVECADVKFFHHPGKALNWAMPALNDEVAAVGNVVVGKGSGKRLESNEAQGRVEEVSLMVCDNQAQLLVHDGITKAGMSGGPVYRMADGAAVGITRGYINDDTSGVKGSVFIPYHTIQAAWTLAQQRTPQAQAAR